MPFLSSTNPDLQLHSRDPGVLVQICSQPPLFVLHSLISIEWRYCGDVIEYLCVFTDVSSLLNYNDFRSAKVYNMPCV